jgi:hypothetical protein
MLPCSFYGVDATASLTATANAMLSLTHHPAILHKPRGSDTPLTARMDHSIELSLAASRNVCEFIALTDLVMHEPLVGLSAPQRLSYCSSVAITALHSPDHPSAVLCRIGVRVPAPRLESKPAITPDLWHSGRVWHFNTLSWPRLARGPCCRTPIPACRGRYGFSQHAEPVGST